MKEKTNREEMEEFLRVPSVMEITREAEKNWISSLVD